MLYIVSGSVGSGKTLQQIRVIMDKLSNGENVVSNIGFKYNVFCDYCITQKNLRNKKLGNYIYIKTLRPEYLVWYASVYHDLSPGAKENQSLLIIDESSEYFTNREWNTPSRKPWIQFMEHLRKLKFAVIVIIQDWEDVDAKITRKAEYIEEHKKVNNINGIGVFLNLLHIELFITITKWNQGGMRVIKKEYFRYKKLYGTLYNTAQMLNEMERLMDEYEGRELVIEEIQLQNEYMQSLRDEYEKSQIPLKQRICSFIDRLNINIQKRFKKGGTKP